MNPFKLFISHSSRLDPCDSGACPTPQNNPNLELLQNLCNDIRAEYGDTIEILVDKEGLKTGEDWEKRLNEWLSECHGAIILFSERARTKSDWVKKEATILSWRREIEKDFYIVPILLDGQTEPEDLEEDLFGTLKINKSQCIKSANNSKDILEGIKEAFTEKEVLSSQYPQTPFEKLVGVISQLLAKNANARTLQEIWDELDNTYKPTCSSHDTYGFAHALTRFMLRDGKNCLINFEIVVDKIRPKIKREHAEELLEYIRSLWIDATAARMIPYARNHNNYLALNGNHVLNYTCKLYIERAFPITNNYKLISLSDTNDIDEIKDEIRQHFQSKRRNIEPEDCDHKIRNSKRQILVNLPATSQQGGGLVEDSRLRRTLKETYPNIIFIFDTGKELPKHLPEDIYKILPELDTDVEKQQLDILDETDDFLNDYYGT